jgi:hypothetical protein
VHRYIVTYDLVTYDQKGSPLFVFAMTAEAAARHVANGGDGHPRANDGDVLHVQREGDDAWMAFACESVRRIEVYPKED